MKEIKSMWATVELRPGAQAKQMRELYSRGIDELCEGTWEKMSKTLYAESITKKLIECIKGLERDTSRNHMYNVISRRF